MTMLLLQFDAFVVVSGLATVGSVNVLCRPLALAAAVAHLPDNFRDHRRAKRIATNLTFVRSILSRRVHPRVAKTQTHLENVSCYCGCCCSAATVQSNDCLSHHDQPCFDKAGLVTRWVP